MSISKRLDKLEDNSLQLAIEQTKALILKGDKLIDACIQSWDCEAIPLGLAPDEFLFLVFAGDYEPPINNDHWQAFYDCYTRIIETIHTFANTLPQNEITAYRQAVQHFVRD